MLPHPDTVCVLEAMDHRQVLAEAARERCVAEARSLAGGDPVLAGVRRGLVRVLGTVRWSRRGSAAPEVGVAPAAPVAR